MEQVRDQIARKVCINLRLRLLKTKGAILVGRAQHAEHVALALADPLVENDSGADGPAAHLVGVRGEELDLPGRPDARPEERRVGKEGVSPCRSRWSPDH